MLFLFHPPLEGQLGNPRMMYDVAGQSITTCFVMPRIKCCSRGWMGCGGWRSDTLKYSQLIDTMYTMCMWVKLALGKYVSSYRGDMINYTRLVIIITSSTAVHLGIVFITSHWLLQIQFQTQITAIKMVIVWEMANTIMSTTALLLAVVVHFIVLLLLLFISPEDTVRCSVRNEY